MSPTPPATRRRKALVFAKAPHPGLAKTRLVPLLGEAGAAALHARLIAHTLATLESAALGDIELHGTPADDDFLRSSAARYGARLVPQCAGDLGERMRAAFQQALATCDCAILIGSDCPALTASHLRRAASALEEGADAVFVPAEDGGYALIGLSRCDERLFERIPWSTPRVMDETRVRLAALGWRWEELETLWDVDTPADYGRLAASGLLEGLAPLG
jgi:rSAM/selenodomain-associated transferase 1